VTGRLNQAALFDGNDSVATNLNVLENSYATSLWFKSDCTGCGIFSVTKGKRGNQGHDRDIYLNGGKVCARVWASSGSEVLCTPGNGYADGKWHHVVHAVGGAPKAKPKVLLHLNDGPQEAPPFTAKYYDNRDLSGKPTCNNVKDQWPISHNWGKDSPPECSGVGKNNFSVRWTGYFYFTGGTYKFTYNVNDGIRVWVGSKLVINDWKRGKAYDVYQTVVKDISSGEKLVTVEYKEHSGDASVYLDWQPLYRDRSGNELATFCARGRCPKSVLGKFDRALQFDGNNDYVGLPRGASILGTGPLAVSAWIKTSRHTDQVVVQQRSAGGTSGYNGEYQLKVAANGKVKWMTYGDSQWGFSFTSNRTVNDGQWHHLVAVRESDGTGRIYIDGKLDASQAGTSRTLVRNFVYIGADMRDNNAFFDGQIDEVSIYNRALSPGDVQMLYSGDRLYVDDVLQATGDRWSSGFTAQTGVTVGYSRQAATHAFSGRLDDVRVFQTGIGQTEVDTLFRAAPILQLHLDEAENATQFTDDSGNGHEGTCSGSGCPQTGFGIAGQLGTAAEFDGVDDMISVADSPALDLDRFTIGAWVMPTNVKNKWQPLIFKGGGTEGRNYGLFIEPNSMQVRFSLRKNDCSTTVYTSTATSLIQNVWNHVMATYDGQDMVIYLNGSPQGSRHVELSSLCHNNAPLRIGRMPGRPYAFAGRIDEVTLYDHALSAREVRAIFDYQGKWVEDRQNHDITVDADMPSSELQLADTYVPNRDIQLLITAHDQTSGVSKVEMGVKKGTGKFTWSEAPACQDAAGNAAWCPTFDPSTQGQGRYTLRTRATDNVGHRERPTQDYGLAVDGTPPTIGLNTGSGSLFNATPHPTQQNTWVVHLSGSIKDPALPDGFFGSGVATDTMRVTLYDDQGAVAGYGNQVATVIGDMWIMDYLLTSQDPSGQYTAVIEAADRVGNRTTFTSQPFYVDAAAPAARLTTSTLTTTITSALTLRGDVSESPVPAAGVERVELAYTPNLPGSPFYNEVPPAGEVLHLPFEDTPDQNGALRFHDVSGQGRDGTCNGDHCPTTGQPGHNGNAVRFDGHDRVRFPSTGPMTATTVSLWVYATPANIVQSPILVEEGGCFGLKLMAPRTPVWEVRVSTRSQSIVAKKAIPARKWVHLAGTYDKQTMRLYRDGELVDSQDTPGAITMPSCLRGDIGRYLNGLVDDVRIFNRALSADEIRSLYLGSGPVLHLPFDDPWVTDSAKLEDTSGWHHRATLHSGANDAVNKAVAGGVGPYALAFDGVDDYASVPDSPALDLSKFGVGVWVQPTYWPENDRSHPLLVKGRKIEGMSTMGCTSTSDRGMSPSNSTNRIVPPHIGSSARRCRSGNGATSWRRTTVPWPGCT